MPEKQLRVAIAGAGTLLGKALVDEIAASPFAAADLRLIDEDDSIGRLAAAGEEATFIHPVGPESFTGCEFAFFAGRRELTRENWRRALSSGCRVVDLSGELENVPGILTRAPWLQEESGSSSARGANESPDLHTRAVVSAHPVAMLLALLSVRLRPVGLRALWATLLQPASEFGHAALEELHQQTTNLLSFQPLPTEVFGAQTAFNMAVSFGGEGRIPFNDVADRISRDFSAIAPGVVAPTLQVIQVPVFHGYGMSVALELADEIPQQALQRAISGSHVRIVSAMRDFPGSTQAVEDNEAQLLIRSAAGTTQSARSRSAEEVSSRFWLWIIADNLKLAAGNAVACAAELNRLLPRGSVQ